MGDTPTLGYSQECDDCDSIPVHAARVVLHIPNRKVEWIILILACGDGHGGLVTSEDYRNEGGPLRVRPHTSVDVILISRCKCTPVKTQAETASDGNSVLLVSMPSCHS